VGEIIINSEIATLPSVLSDIRAQLAALTQTETLSSDGARMLMMAQRLLTMFEADRQLTSSHESEAEIADSKYLPPARRRQLVKSVIDQYEARTNEMQRLRDAVAGADSAQQAPPAGDPCKNFIEYLSRQAGRPLGPLKKFQPVTGGYSKTTIAAELAPEDDFGWGTQLIVRLDVKDGPTSFTVADEFPLLARLYGSCVPVARPFACETDLSVLGQPFLVSALLPGISAASGDPTVAAWGDDPVLRRGLGLQIAQALGALHSVSPDGAARPAAEQVKDYLREWRLRWLGLGAPPEPALAVAFDWLEDNIPTRIERLAYVHGDFAPYNALQDKGQLTAIIDWEFVHLGDPAEDVGYCRTYMEALLPWEAFLEAYHSHGGPPYHSESAKFYEVWCNVRNAVVLLQGRQAYVSGRNRALKTLYALAEFYHYFLLNALRSIRAAL
jgi:aminoglycoside phosphotransferase (APT) family kinase protein